jgi:hypothetical protein
MTHYSPALLDPFHYIIRFIRFVYSRVEHVHWLKELKAERESHAQRQSRRKDVSRQGSISSRKSPDERPVTEMSSRALLSLSPTSPSPANVPHLSPVGVGPTIITASDDTSPIAAVDTNNAPVTPIPPSSPSEHKDDRKDDNDSPSTTTHTNDNDDTPATSAADKDGISIV